MRNTLLTVLAVAIAIAFSSLPQLQAAMLVSPGSQPGTENLAHLAKAKKSKGPGSCGTYYYYAPKKHKCMDARAKP